MTRTRFNVSSQRISQWRLPRYKLVIRKNRTSRSTNVSRYRCLVVKLPMVKKRRSPCCQRVSLVTRDRQVVFCLNVPSNRSQDIRISMNTYQNQVIHVAWIMSGATIRVSRSSNGRLGIIYGTRLVVRSMIPIRRSNGNIIIVCPIIDMYRIYLGGILGQSVTIARDYRARNLATSTRLSSLMFLQEGMNIRCVNMSRAMRNNTYRVTNDLG